MAIRKAPLRIVRRYRYLLKGDVVVIDVIVISIVLAICKKYNTGRVKDLKD